MRLLGERITEAASGPGGQDYKTRLREIAAHRFETVAPLRRRRGRGPTTPSGSSPPVWVDGELRGEGSGRSKKQAEQSAARDAWEKLRDARRGVRA